MPQRDGEKGLFLTLRKGYSETENFDWNVMTLTKAFGKTLKKLRLSCGFSQSELAEAARLDRTFISLLECGKRQPTLKTIFALGKSLKIAPNQIVNETERAMKTKNDRKNSLPSRRL